MFDKLVSDLKAINVWQVIDDYMNRNEQNILKLAKDRMKRGESVYGSGPIGYYQSKWYREFKEVLNPFARGTVDLYLTGSLQSAMEIRKAYNGYYFILSTDQKYFSLAEKYGAEEFGLTDKQIEEVKSNAIDELINKINKAYE